MPGVTQWRHLMPYTVIVETCSTMDSYGARTYQSCSAYRAAIQGPAKFMHQSSQQERVSRQTLILATVTPITVLDRVTLPSSFEIRQPPILQVTRFSDGLGAHHSTIYLG